MADGRLAATVTATAPVVLRTTIADTAAPPAIRKVALRRKAAGVRFGVILTPLCVMTQLSGATVPKA